MTREALAVAFMFATKTRAQARTHLSALRKKYLEETGEFFDEDEGKGEEGYEEMMAALKAREEANAEYRRAKSRLFRACAAGNGSAGERPTDETAQALDARRYRWLLASDWYIGPQPEGDTYGVSWNNMNDGDLNAAILAAMEKP